MIVQNVDINARHNRAIFLLVDGRRMRFGVAIKRPHPVKDRWCFYVGLTPEEYSFFVELGSEELSFLNLPDPILNVPQMVAEKVMVESPGYYAGTHIDSDPWNRNWNGDSIIGCMQQFAITVSELLKNEVESSPNLVGV